MDLDKWCLLWVCDEDVVDVDGVFLMLMGD